GMGDRFEESNMLSFSAGSFAYFDPDMHHYPISADLRSYSFRVARHPDIIDVRLDEVLGK
ncbi:MAG: hypothetical protein WAN76_17265, partial [Candidatus Sulfotelmatobacter sp.]